MQHLPALKGVAVTHAASRMQDIRADLMRCMHRGARLCCVWVSTICQSRPLVSDHLNLMSENNEALGLIVLILLSPHPAQSPILLSPLFAQSPILCPAQTSSLPALSHLKVCHKHLLVASPHLANVKHQQPAVHTASDIVGVTCMA